jgi:hypothetical protein
VVRGRAVSLLLRALLVLAVLGLSSPARADVSSWISAAAGVTVLEDKVGRSTAPTLELKTGIGTPPLGDFLAVGGLFQLQTHFGKGTDLGLLARFATKGYVLGDFGIALDLGGYQRFFGERSRGGLGALVLGAPWGLFLSAGGGLGTENERHAGLVLGIDFARLTVYRDVGTSYFPNPHPAFRK